MHGKRVYVKACTTESGLKHWVIDALGGVTGDGGGRLVDVLRNFLLHSAVIGFFKAPMEMIMWNIKCRKKQASVKFRMGGSFMRLVVAVTGATGSIYAVRLLETLEAKEVDVHLIVSKWAAKTLHLETGLTVDCLQSLSDYHYEEDDLSAPISSGSFQHDGMVIVPCSMKTLAAVAHGFDGNLIERAADVTLKERRKLILVPRETPLSAIHLNNMLTLSQLGAVIMPPMPAFYYHPKSIDDLVNHLVGKIIDHLGQEQQLVPRWEGISSPTDSD